MLRDIGIVISTFGIAVITISFSFVSLGLSDLFSKALILGFLFAIAGFFFIYSSLASLEEPRLVGRAFLRGVKNEPLKFLFAFVGILLMILGAIIAYVIT